MFGVFIVEGWHDRVSLVFVNLQLFELFTIVTNSSRKKNLNILDGVEIWRIRWSLRNLDFFGCEPSHR
uniref:Uncharacterized protein n=1 Tax=Caenorhabditis japonica TaxID=281687 RepID=A0A8R1ENN1_CAEJA